MAKSKQIKVADRRAVQQPTPPTQDEADNSDVEVRIEQEKDETEQELERLIFGDSAGFREGFKDVALQDSADEDVEEGENTGLEGLDDADVGQTALCDSRLATTCPC